MTVHVAGLARLEQRGEIRCRVDGCTLPQLPNDSRLCLHHFRAAQKLLSAMSETEARKAAKDGLTFVYFAQPVGGGPIKIGKTRKHPEQRLSSLQVGSPVPLELLGWLSCEWWLEQALHRALEQHLVQGEWFKDAPEVRLLVAMAKDGMHDKIHEFAKANGGIKYKKRRSGRQIRNAMNSADFMRESLPQVY